MKILAESAESYQSKLREPDLLANALPPFVEAIDHGHIALVAFIQSHGLEDTGAFFEQDYPLHYLQIHDPETITLVLDVPC